MESDYNRAEMVPLVANNLDYDQTLLKMNDTPGPWAKIIRRVKARMRSDIENIARKAGFR